MTKTVSINLTKRNYPIHTVTMNGVFFQGGRGPVIFSPARQTLGGFFHGNDSTQIKEANNSFRVMMRKNGMNAELLYCDFVGDMEVPTIRSFTYHKITGTLHRLLYDFNEQLNTIDTTVNKRNTIIVLRLDESNMEELYSNLTLNLLTELIQNGLKKRVTFFIMCEKASAIPSELFKLFDWCFFSGKANMAFCEQYFRLLPEIAYNANRELAGLVYDKALTFITPVHNLYYEESFYKKQMNEVDRLEEEAYEKLLAKFD